MNQRIYKKKKKKSSSLLTPHCSVSCLKEKVKLKFLGAEEEMRSFGLNMKAFGDVNLLWTMM